MPDTDDIAAALRLAGYELTPERADDAAPLVRAMRDAAARLAALDLSEPPDDPA